MNTNLAYQEEIWDEMLNGRTFGYDVASADLQS